ncbi:hypothetical protein FNV43_RR06597 [Rhamnella rubrinervis]|uniref:Uncharacterized protein n=1 Tax=Rhamnella rubrinervis TaxID=2594499 RepID=A0A8K0HE82_9ROSA|nr:hypothetical protein FNV43_RR06597 [Rhamnella rubrinervis]
MQKASGQWKDESETERRRGVFNLSGERLGFEFKINRLAETPFRLHCSAGSVMIVKCNTLTTVENAGIRSGKYSDKKSPSYTTLALRPGKVTKFHLAEPPDRGGKLVDYPGLGRMNGQIERLSSRSNRSGIRWPIGSTGRMFSESNALNHTLLLELGSQA